MRRTSIPDRGNCADQLFVLTNHFRRHTADMSLDIETYLFEQTRASKPLSAEYSTHLRLTGPNRLGNRSLRDMPLPTDFGRAKNPSLLIGCDHSLCIVLRISAL